MFVPHGLRMRDTTGRLRRFQIGNLLDMNPMAACKAARRSRWDRYRGFASEVAVVPGGLDK
jgi:hypothetical protein